MPKEKINLVGQRFGKLIVVAETRKNDRRAWTCQCDCGGIRIAMTSDLKLGRTTSCGCGKKLDITGQKYGKLTAIKPTGQKNKNGIIWECLCDCGNIHYTTPSAMRTGNVLSCGCGRAEAVTQANKQRAHNLLGQKFGKLTVIEKADNRNERTCWNCSCECGNTIITTTKNLLDGHTTSCGCLSESKGENKIKTILQKYNIKYEQEKQFSDLLLDTKKFARYDFYLPDYNCLIEYDGVQHFKIGNGVFDNPEKFAKTQEHDSIKNEYAKSHNITLIRIPYTHYENIELADLLPLTSSFVV